MQLEILKGHMNIDTKTFHYIINQCSAVWPPCRHDIYLNLVGPGTAFTGLSSAINYSNETAVCNNISRKYRSNYILDYIIIDLS